MSARRLTLVTLVWLCALGGVLLLGAPAASASQIRPYIGSFAAEAPAGVAVDQETGNVYVAEALAGVVAVSGADGGPAVGGVPARSPLFSSSAGEVGVAIDNSCYYHQPRLSGSECEAFDLSNGDLYVTSEHTATNPEGAIEKLRLNVLAHEYEVIQELPFTEPTGVAVDHEGDLYAVGPREQGISEFSSSGIKVAIIEQTTLEQPAFVAAGAPGVVYVGENNFKGRGVAKLEVGPKGELERQVLLDSEGNAVAVEGHGDVLVDDSSYISEYGPSGALIGVSGSGRLVESEGVAVDEESQHAYVSTQARGAEAIDVFGGLVAVPAIATGSASNITLTSATIAGDVDPEGVLVTLCTFEYGITASYGATVPCAQGVGSGSAPVPVTAELHGLQPATVYHYRLIAANASIADQPALGEDRTFSTGARVESESVARVTASSATLLAQINPESALTEYHFEYGVSSSYGTSVPIPDGLIGSGGEGQTVSEHLQGLDSSTVYHYRVVAKNSAGKVDGPDQTFTTQGFGGSSQTADGREWEMVSPPQKDGALIKPIQETGLIKASVAGDAISYFANAPIESEPRGSSNEDQILSLRSAAGWSTQNIAPPHEVATGVLIGDGEEYRFFSEDLSLGVMQQLGPLAASMSEEASEPTAFLRESYMNGNVSEPCTTSCYHPLVTGCPPVGQACPPDIAENANVPAGTVFGGNGKSTYASSPFFEGGTPDLSHVVLRSEVGLTPGSNGGLYEWSGGKLVFLGVPSGINGFRSISNDGSRVVFAGESEGQNGLLVRDVGRGETVLLGGGEFQFASENGSKVFFTDGDLYECDLVVEAGKLQCALSDLTLVGSAEGQGDVAGRVLGASKDGSWMYFVAGGVLASGAVPGGSNLYVHHGGVTKLMAVLSDKDGPDWSSDGLDGHTARVSPNGEWLAFMSQAKLTSYDNHDALSGNPDEEVYLYHGSTGDLACASCNPTGARPVGVEYKSFSYDSAVGGDRVWPGEQWVAANIPGWTPSLGTLSLYQSRYLADSGRLFFNSSDALIPQDVNGTEDVYEYEPPGVGACTTDSMTFGVGSGGCVGLISAGTSAEESGFMDASESGGDVFFLTTSKLLAQDFDASSDVYDAHECRIGSPCFAVPAVSPPVCSTGDSCKAAPSPQPAIFGSPSSATFSGAGNVTVTPASSVAGKAKPLSRAQKLARALKECRKKKGKQKAVCERKAKTRYGTAGSSKVNATKRGKR